jgi:hypothetical protein
MLPGSLALLLAMPGHLSAETPPAWVQKGGADPDTYPSARYLIGYGISSPGASEADQRRQALAMAEEALAGTIRTHVTSEFTSRVTQQDQRMSRFAQNLVRTGADVELDGLDTILVWHDPRGKLTHALAVMDKAKALQILDDRIERNARECGSAFEKAKAAGDARGLLQARHLRQGVEEGLLVRAVLGGPPGDPACPPLTGIDHELRQVLASRKGLDGCVAVAALDLGSGLPKGIRVLMDRVTYADTPFCGSLSAYLEQALASEMAALGQVKIVDKAAGREAIRKGGMDADLPEALRSQAVVRGVCFDLGESVRISLRVTALGGEELAAATVVVPAAIIRQAGLKVVPDNFEEARKALEICNARIQASRLKVKLALDRGDGGMYRKGESLYLFLKANQDCYVKVVYHQVDGTNVVIFPNPYHPDARIQKDRLYQIPPDDHSFDLEVTAPFGVEVVKVMASTEPLDAPGEAHGMQAVGDDLASLIGQTRGIGLKKAEAQYAEDTAVVNTMAGTK